MPAAVERQHAAMRPTLGESENGADPAEKILRGVAAMRGHRSLIGLAVREHSHLYRGEDACKLVRVRELLAFRCVDGEDAKLGPVGGADGWVGTDWLEAGMLQECLHREWVERLAPKRPHHDRPSAEMVPKAG
jgi:hypothetical protein